MRITNQIMQRNSLGNINNNKTLQDTLTTQMSTQKKINRASDDPVVAIRALRLRSNVTEVSQYYSKNIPDANSWLEITESALNNTATIITKMQEQATKGANGDLTSDDREIIIEQLKALADEVYATGDSSYAGRYVFTGYRTDTPLSFQAQKTNTTYEITEQVKKDVIDQITHVNLGDLSDWTNANCTDASSPVSKVNETNISTSDVYRIRLSYNEIDEKSTPKIQYYDPATRTDEEYVADATVLSTGEIDGKDPYAYVAANADKIVLLSDTGELLIGKDIYDKLMSTKDSSTTSLKDEGEIRIIYEKTKFDATDLRPEHFFACKATTWETNALGENTTTREKYLEFNQDYLKGGLIEKQSIEYDVGFNQTIKINTTADEAYNLGIVREVDDLVSALLKVQNLEDLKKNIESKMTHYADGSSEYNSLKDQLVAAEKALTYEKNTCQKRFEKGITSFQGFLDDASIAITGVGTRSSKLELIEGRMQNQKTTFETLKSQNEDIDITEVAIQLSSAELTYQAALTATGKLIQNSLVNYI